MRNMLNANPLLLYENSAHVVWDPVCRRRTRCSTWGSCCVLRAWRCQSCPRRGARVVPALLVHRAHVLLQVARLRARVCAVGACVVPALLVHHEHVHRQAAFLRKRSGAVGAHVVPALLVHRAHVCLQVARPSERSGAVVGARVVPALLVHRAHVLRQAARLPERGGAVGARVVPALLVHRAHVHVAVVGPTEGTVAAWAGVFVPGRVPERRFAILHLHSAVC